MFSNFSEKENGKKKPDRAKKTENQNDSSDEEETNHPGKFIYIKG